MTFLYSLVQMKEQRYAILAIARQTRFVAAVYFKIIRVHTGLHLVRFFSDATGLYAQGMHHHMAVSLFLYPARYNIPGFQYFFSLFQAPFSVTYIVKNLPKRDIRPPTWLRHHAAQR